MSERERMYQRALAAIAGCTLTGVDFGDYVQAVHDGPCVGEEAAA